MARKAFLTSLLTFLFLHWPACANPRHEYDYEAFLAEHESVIRKHKAQYADGKCRDPLKDASFMFIDAQHVLERSLAYGVRAIVHA